MAVNFITDFEDIPSSSEVDITKNVDHLTSYIDLGLKQDYGTGDLKQFVTEILKYLKKLLDRFQSNLNEDIDYHSWLARNIYELYILTQYGLQSPDKISEVLLTAVDDYRDIQNNLYKNYEPTEEDQDGKEFLAAMDKLNSVIDEHGIEIIKWKSTGKMADEIDLKLNQSIVFKITSKCVHPTSLFLFGNKNFVHGKNLRKTFFSLSQFYAASLLTYMPGRIEELKSAT